MKETRKKERDEMGELYALKRSAGKCSSISGTRIPTAEGLRIATGYSSDLNTFRGVLISL